MVCLYYFGHMQCFSVCVCVNLFRKLAVVFPYSACIQRPFSLLVLCGKAISFCPCLCLCGHFVCIPLMSLLTLAM